MDEIQIIRQQRRVALVLAIALFASIIFASVAGFVLLNKSNSKITVLPTPEVTNSVRRSGMYPDPLLTPGDVFIGITKDVICVSGYTKTVRDVPLSLRKQIFSSYKIPYPPLAGAYELDHFIPLAIGGSNDAKNLWPETAEPRPGFHEKDVVEVYLLDQVCHHNLDLQKAQEAVRNDWYLVYESIPNKSKYVY